MKYVKKMPQTDKQLSSELISDGWSKLKEPSSLSMATLMSLPFMIINTVIYIVLIYFLYPPLREVLTSSEVDVIFSIDIIALVLLLTASLLLMIIHEFIHALFIPNVLKSDKTFWGINGLYGFVFSTEKFKKGRFIIISIMPFILLSIILPIILSYIGLLNVYTIALCLINAAGSCVDMLNIFLIATQVPNNSLIINNGFETYFKKKN